MSKFITFSLYRDEEFEAFYDTDSQSRRRIIYANLMLNLLPLLVLTAIFRDYLGANLLTAYLIYSGLILYVASGFEPIAYLYPSLRTRYKQLFPYYMLLLGLAGVPVGIFLSQLGFALGSGAESMELPAFLLTSFLSDRNLPDITIARLLSGVSLSALAAIMVYFGQSLILLASRTLYTRRAEVESDVRFAREVQNRLLQEVQIRGDGVDACARSVPANALGGDFFELSRNGRVLTAAVGDISGHSFGAGLLMAMCKSALSTHLSYGTSLSEIMRSMNTLIFSQSDRRMFATLILLRIDLDTAELTLCNAGHPSLFLVGEEPREISGKRGLALGMMSKSTWLETSLTLNANEIIMLYSDGLVEIRDESGSVRDESFFPKLVSGAFQNGRTADELVTLIEEAVGAMDFSNRADDDRTVVVIRLSNG